MSHYHEQRLNDYCHVSSQTATHCDEREIYCEVCGGIMTQEHGEEVLICDDCEHKQWQSE